MKRIKDEAKITNINLHHIHWLSKDSDLNAHCQNNIPAAEDDLSVDDFLFLVRVETAV